MPTADGKQAVVSMQGWFDQNFPFPEHCLTPKWINWLNEQTGKKIIHPANFDRQRQEYTRSISLKEIAEELLLLMETVNQKSNYTQVNSKVGELLQLPSAYTVQLFFQIQSRVLRFPSTKHLFSILTPHYKNQPMLALH